MLVFCEKRVKQNETTFKSALLSVILGLFIDIQQITNTGF